MQWLKRECHIVDLKERVPCLWTDNLSTPPAVFTVPNIIFIAFVVATPRKSTEFKCNWRHYYLWKGGSDGFKYKRLWTFFSFRIFSSHPYLFFQHFYCAILNLNQLLWFFILAFLFCSLFNLILRFLRTWWFFPLRILHMLIFYYLTYSFSNDSI